MNKQTVYGFINELLQVAGNVSVHQSHEVGEFYFNITGFIGNNYYSVTIIKGVFPATCTLSQVTDDVPEFLSIVGEFENKIDFKIR